MLVLMLCQPRRPALGMCGVSGGGAGASSSAAPQGQTAWILQCPQDERLCAHPSGVPLTAPVVTAATCQARRPCSAGHGWGQGACQSAQTTLLSSAYGPTLCTACVLHAGSLARQEPLCWPVSLVTPVACARGSSKHDSTHASILTYRLAAPQALMGCRHGGAQRAGRLITPTGSAQGWSAHTPVPSHTTPVSKPTKHWVQALWCTACKTCTGWAARPWR